MHRSELVADSIQDGAAPEILSDVQRDVQTVLLLIRSETHLLNLPGLWPRCMLGELTDISPFRN